jgi:AraC-like DNA-binding protein
VHKETVYLNLDTNNISPVLIRTYVYNLYSEDWKFEKFEERYIENYEFEYIFKSEGNMYLEGTTYPLRPGDICFKKPGELTQGIKPYSCFMVSFKLTTDQHTTTFQPNYNNQIINAIPPIYSTKNRQYFEMIFKKILDEYLNGCESSMIKIKSYILDIIYNLYEEIKQNFLPSSPYYGVISKSVKYIEENYQNKILLDDIANHVGISPFYFHRIFKQTMQISPNDYLSNIRINNAKQLLIMTSESITDIALKCGFESSSYFCFIFKQKMNISPNSYRKSHKML